MNKFVFALALLFVAASTIVSAQTLFEACGNLCGIAGKVIEENMDSFAEECQEWLKEYPMEDCDGVQTMLMALVQRGQEMREEGREEEFAENMKSGLQVVGEKMAKAMQEGITDECKEQARITAQCLDDNIGKW